jgi:lipopolysaccharide transport system ATP-binding protein
MSNSNEVAVQVSNLSKMYRMYDKPSDMFWEILTGKPRYTEFWALKDIDLEVRRGDVLGIIGPNGAGKSTLLKILAGTLDKSSGTVEIDGKITALLELGTGFHSEYTGRENIYMGGMCLGLSREEIDIKIESIVEFSGLRRYIDNPFKTYSSGMQARLTFSLAMGIDPDILIIDEALAVGDAIFVNKCIGKIREICSNTTTIFVSHGLEMLRSFCNKAMWLHEGRIVTQGQVDPVCKAYERYIHEQSETYLQSDTEETMGVCTAEDLVQLSKKGDSVNDIAATSEFFQYGSKEVAITDFKVLDRSGMERRQFNSGEYVEFQVYYEGEWDREWELHAGVRVFTDRGVLVFTPSTLWDGAALQRPMAPKGIFRFIFEQFIIGAGEYTLSPITSLVKGKERRWTDYHDRVYRIRISSSKYPFNYIVEHPVTVEWNPL